MIKLPDLTQRQKRAEEAHPDLDIDKFRDLVVGRQHATRHFFVHNYALEGAIYRRDFLSELIDDTEFRRQFDKIHSGLPEKEIRHIKISGIWDDPALCGDLHNTVRAQIRQLEKWATLPKTLEQMAALRGGTEGAKDLRAFARKARRSLQDFVPLAEKLSAHIREQLEYPGMNDDADIDDGHNSDELDLGWAGECIRRLAPFYPRLAPIAQIRSQLSHYRILCKPYEWKFDGRRIPSCKPEFLDPDERRGNIINAHNPAHFKYEIVRELGKRARTVIRALDVPNDIHWGDDARGTFIQGANSRGKSVYVKTIALNIHLAMAGLRCFADSAALSPVREIFPCFDMGASMGEGHFGTGAYKVKYMLDHVTRNDIVLLDEAGGGTEPDAERQIARGISDALIKSGVTFFNITHDRAAWKYHRGEKGVAVLRVADLDDEVRKYKVWPGIAKGGYGMEKARELGIDPQSAYETLRRRLD